MANQVAGMGKGGIQFRIRACIVRRAVAAQGQHIVNAHAADRIEKGINFFWAGGHAGQVRHDRKTAGIDQLLADLQGIVLGGTARAIRHGTVKRIESGQFLGGFQKGRPFLLFFRRKKLKGDKRTALGYKFGDSHAGFALKVIVAVFFYHSRSGRGQIVPATIPAGRRGRTLRCHRAV